MLINIKNWSIFFPKFRYRYKGEYNGDANPKIKWRTWPTVKKYLTRPVKEHLDLLEQTFMLSGIFDLGFACSENSRKHLGLSSLKYPIFDIPSMR